MLGELKIMLFISFLGWLLCICHLFLPGFQACVYAWEESKEGVLIQMLANLPFQLVLWLPQVLFY